MNVVAAIALGPTHEAWPVAPTIRARLWAGVLAADRTGPGRSPIPDAGLVICPPTADHPLGSKFGDDRWVFPAELVSSPRLSNRMIDFGIAVGGGRLSDPEHAELLVAAKCYVLAVLVHPRRHYLNVLSVVTRWNLLRRALRYVVEQGYPLGLRTFRDFDLADLEALSRWMSEDWRIDSSSFTSWAQVLDELCWYGEQGIVPDWPARVDLHLPALRLFGKDRPTAAQARREAEERAPASRPELQADPRATYAYPPLSLDTVTRLVSVARYYVYVLGPHVAALMESFATIQRRARAIAEEKGSDARYIWRAEFAKVAQNHRWTCPKGMEIERPPFPIPYAWPPATTLDLQTLASSTVAANLVLISLPTGMRESELLSLHSGSLVVEPAGYVNGTDDRAVLSLAGRTYKWSGQPGGQEASWPVPEPVGRAVELQVTMFSPYDEEVARETTTKPLFRSLKLEHLGKPVASGLTSLMRRFARSHAIEILDPDGVAGNLHSARFRPTVAVVLARIVPGAPRILKRLFGHRSIKTTLDYIYSHPAMRASIHQARHSAASVSSAAADPTSTAVTTAPADDRATASPRPMREIVQRSLKQGRDLRMVMPGALCPGCEDDHGCRFDGHGCEPCGWSGEGAEARTNARECAEMLATGCRDRRVRFEPLLRDWYMRELHAHALAFPDVEADLRQDRSIALLLPVKP